MKNFLLGSGLIILILGLSACVKNNSKDTNSSYANYPSKQVNPNYRQRTQAQNTQPCSTDAPHYPCDTRPLFDPSLPPNVAPNNEPAQGG